MGEMMKEAISLIETPASPNIFIPEAWSQAADTIAYDSVTSPPPVAFICGPKNSGKTTFSRILLNTLLQRYKKVAYLDTDVGQPEFTTPGFLSLTIIDRHTPDLTIACLKTPERCIFYGDTSAKRDPQTYVDNIFSLYDYFYKEYYMPNESEERMKPQLPLVINTSGWVKGIGYDTLVEMLKYIAPTHVVKVQISSVSKNLPSGAFWLDSDQEPSVQLIEIGSARHDVFNRSVLVRKDAPVIRDLRIVAYFRQCFPIDFDITTFKELAHAMASHPPYEVPISRIKVKHLHCQVPSSEIFHSLNATIVGLAVSAEKSTDNEPCTPWCVGLGIVRGINVSKDLLYVLTPVPRSSLEKVDLFLQGLIPIPNRLLQILGWPVLNLTSRCSAGTRMHLALHVYKCTVNMSESTGANILAINKESFQETVQNILFPFRFENKSRISRVDYGRVIIYTSHKPPGERFVQRLAASEFNAHTRIKTV